MCRDLIEGGHRSIKEAIAQDPDLPTARPSRAQVRNALSKLELAGVVDIRKGGYWTSNRADELVDILMLIRSLPAGLATLENLAHPVGWSVIARLAARQTTRRDLHVCGDSARVTEQVKALVRARAVVKQTDVLILLNPTDHRAVQDHLDTTAKNLGMFDMVFAEMCLSQPDLRLRAGQLYCSTEP
ncbi:MAG: hypothetical protein WKF96_06595 [Solirubrobacteraceae bacterium]